MNNDHTLEWTKPMSSHQAAKYHMTNGFVAVELYNIVCAKNTKLQGIVDAMEEESKDETTTN